VTLPGGTDIEVQATLAGGFEPSDASATLGTAGIAGSVVTWHFDALGSEVATLEYHATHDGTMGGGALPVHADVTYSDNEGNEITFPALTVNVRGCAASLSLDPAAATNEFSGTAGQSHGVTATVLDDFGDPVSDIDVDFDVTGGPNAGAAMASDATAGDGTATSSYTTLNSGPTGLGDDTIEASVAVQTNVPTALTATAGKSWVDTTAPVPSCAVGTNPAGRGAGAGSGFRVLAGSDDVWSSVDLYLTDPVSGTVFGPFDDGTKVKLTVDPDASPSQPPMAGHVDWHIKTQGQAYLTAVDGSGNETDPVTCGATS
jgi:hypothetical protein